MKLAFCLFKLFPYGGLARDCIRIIELCRQQEAQIDVYVMTCQDVLIEDVNIEILPVTGLTNHAKVANYIEQLQSKLANGNYDLVIGFNKMPGLDLYYAADPCYIDRVKRQANYRWMQWSRRVKFYHQNEVAVFGSASKTISLQISSIQLEKFKRCYATPASRLVLLPPGIDPSRKRTSDWQFRRQCFRKDNQLSERDLVLLALGTGFKTKGVDRTIKAIAALPEKLRVKVKLLVVGDGEIASYQTLAQKLGIAERILFCGARDNIPDFLLAADLLVHPARKENTGTVILEALVAGLPVLVSGACGYAHHVHDAQAGEVSPEPFQQLAFSQQLSSMLDRDRLKNWSLHALAYAEQADLYSMPQAVMQIITTMAQQKQKIRE